MVNLMPVSKVHLISHESVSIWDLWYLMNRYPSEIFDISWIGIHLRSLISHESVSIWDLWYLMNRYPSEIFDISWIGIHLRSLPLPKAIRNLSISSFWNIEIAYTTTYVSVLLTKDVFNPWTAACFTWTNILVSAYSRLQGQRPDQSIL
jgi:hypothetical protein